MTEPALSLAREFEAAIAWWHAAGVDCDFDDDVTAWLAEAPLEAPATPKGVTAGTSRNASAPQDQTRQAKQQMAPPAPPPAPNPTVLRRDMLGDSPPADLAAFRQWWLEAAGIDAARLYPRIAPRGAEGASLMVLVPQPEEQDRDSLMEGPQGRLLGNILAAMGLDDNAVYLAAALPCYTPMADLAAIGAGGMDAVVAHHIALAQPKRLLVLGTGLAAMLGAQDNQPLREINHSAGKVPVMVSETLDAMMDMPRLKARFWKRWIEWSAS
jgi:uracil-DNA glycosylase